MSDFAFRSFTTTLHFTRGAVGGSRPGSNVNKPTCMVTREHVIGFIMCGKFLFVCKYSNALFCSMSN